MPSPGQRMYDCNSTLRRRQWWISRPIRTTTATAITATLTSCKQHLEHPGFITGGPFRTPGCSGVFSCPPIGLGQATCNREPRPARRWRNWLQTQGWDYRSGSTGSAGGGSSGVPGSSNAGSGSSGSAGGGSSGVPGSSNAGSGSSGSAGGGSSAGPGLAVTGSGLSGCADGGDGGGAFGGVGRMLSSSAPRSPAG